MIWSILWVISTWFRVALDRLHSSARDPPDLRQWAETYALTVVWRHMHLNSREFTCHLATYKTLSRIDLVFASRTALKYVQGVSVLPRGISDHAPLCLSLALTIPPESRLWRRSRFWANDERGEFVTIGRTTKILPLYLCCWTYLNHGLGYIHIVT